MDLSSKSRRKYLSLLRNSKVSWINLKEEKALNSAFMSLMGVVFLGFLSGVANAASEKKIASEVRSTQEESVPLSLRVGLLFETNEEVDHGSEADREPGAIYPELKARAGYSLVDSIKIFAAFGYKFEDATDPEFGFDFELPSTSFFKAEMELAASAPASKESRDNRKTTSVALEFEPTFSFGKWFVGLNGSVEKNFYDKDPEGGQAEEFSVNGDPELQAELVYMHEREDMLIETGGMLGRKIGQLEAAIGLNITEISHIESETAWETELTVLELAYSEKQFSGGVAYGYKGEQTVVKIPQRPVIAAELTYELQ